MRVGQVERSGGWATVRSEGRPGGRRVPAEPGLSIGELRQWLTGRPGAQPSRLGARCVLPSRARWQLLRSTELLRRRVERFNQDVPVGLKVTLNPELIGLLAEAPLCES
jgi:hypothetical protein